MLVRFDCFGKNGFLEAVLNSFKEEHAGYYGTPAGAVLVVPERGYAEAFGPTVLAGFHEDDHSFSWVRSSGAFLQVFKREGDVIFSGRRHAFREMVKHFPVLKELKNVNYEYLETQREDLNPFHVSEKSVYL